MWSQSDQCASTWSSTASRSVLGKLVPHHRSCGGRAAGDRYPLYRHQPRHTVGPDDLPGHLLRPETGREPHQGVEDPSGCRLHLMQPCGSQPDAPIFACRRLLVDVKPAHTDATPLALAGCAVRYVTAALDQACRAHRGAEDAAPPAPAEGDARSGDLYTDADAHAAPQLLNNGRIAPHIAPADQPKRPPATNACTNGPKTGRRRPMHPQLQVEISQACKTCASPS